MTAQTVHRDTSADFDTSSDRHPIRARIRNLMYTYPVIGPMVVLLISVAVFSLMSDRFLSPVNLSLITQQVMVIGIAAIGQTMIILTAGIDLSVGSIAVLSSIVMSLGATKAGLPGWLALLLGFAVGTLCGLFNGVLVVRLKLPPFIATLGTLSVFYALGLFLSGGAAIRGVDMPSLLTDAGNSFPLFGTQIAYGVILLLVLVAAFAYALQMTAWGRHVYATGDDIGAARLTGIRTNRVLLSVYIVAGLLYGIAAWVLVGRTGAASPQSATTLNLDTITAVVIGGTSLFGGRGLVVGSLVGALIVGVFRNGLALAGVDVLWQEFAVGLLILAAVAADQWIRKGNR